MNNKRVIRELRELSCYENNFALIGCDRKEALKIAIKVLEERINKTAMLYDIYMEGVNMAGEYKGVWVQYKDIEKIVDNYITESE